MKVRLPISAAPAQIMLHVWQQVQTQPTPRTLDKHVANDAGLLEQWQGFLSASDTVDAETLMNVLRYQAHNSAEMELTEDETDQAMRACAKCRLYLQSPWLDLQLPTVQHNDTVLTEGQLIGALLSWFGLLEETLIMIQHGDWADSGSQAL